MLSYRHEIKRFLKQFDIILKPFEDQHLQNLNSEIAIDNFKLKLLKQYL